MMNWRSSWTLNFVVSMTTSARRRIGRHAAALFANAFGDGAAMRQGMRAARFAEAADQRIVARFDEDQRDGMLAAQPAVHLRQIFDLLALASVHEQRGALDFSAAALVKFAEGGNQSNGKIVYAVKAEVFEGIEYGALAGAGQAGEKHELAPIAFPGGAGHGGGR